MKKLFLLLAFPLMAHAADPFVLPITEIHDGDTISTSIFLPKPLNSISVRLLGIDTPEMPAASYATTGKLDNAKCRKEADLAIKARDFVRDIAAKNNNQMTIDNYQWDKYGSRIDADVFIGGISVAKALIDNKMAVPYTGGTKVTDWCK